MKKQYTPILIAAACVLLAFVLGFSVGRSQPGKITVTETTRQLPASGREYTLLVNINTASASELAVLPGIGESFGQKIVDYREANGPFAQPEELLHVDGIGQARLEAILDYITVGGTP